MWNFSFFSRPVLVFPSLRCLSVFFVDGAWRVMSSFGPPPSHPRFFRSCSGWFPSFFCFFPGSNPRLFGRPPLLFLFSPEDFLTPLRRVTGFFLTLPFSFSRVQTESSHFVYPTPPRYGDLRGSPLFCLLGIFLFPRPRAGFVEVPRRFVPPSPSYPFPLQDCPLPGFSGFSFSPHRCSFSYIFLLSPQSNFPTPMCYIFDSLS